MTTRVWVERPITSVEDAEGLPIDSIALLDGVPEAWKCGCTDHDTVPPTHGVWHATDGHALTPDWWIACTALLPVEAEEETLAGHAVTPDGGPDLVRRLVTSWEATR